MRVWKVVLVALLAIVVVWVTRPTRAYNTLLHQSIHYLARPHEGPLTKPLNTPLAAWSGLELPQERDGVAWREVLTRPEVDACASAVQRVRQSGKDMHDLVASDFEFGEAMTKRITAWRSELSDPARKGFVVIRTTMRDWPESDLAIFFWGLGLLLGVPGAQNHKNDLLGHVRNDGSAPGTVRQYRTKEGIMFHCDLADVVGLICVTKAEKGGASAIASSVRVFNEIVTSRPDLAPLLFTPFLLDTRGDGGVDAADLIPSRYFNGSLSTFWHSHYYITSYEQSGAVQRPEEIELINLYQALATKHQISMNFDVGDIQLINNHRIVHARSKFEDGEQQRHLLRLWISLDAAEWDLSARGLERTYRRAVATVGVIGDFLKAKWRTWMYPVTRKPI